MARWSDNRIATDGIAGGVVSGMRPAIDFFRPRLPMDLEISTPPHDCLPPRGQEPCDFFFRHPVRMVEYQQQIDRPVGIRQSRLVPMDGRNLTVKTGFENLRTNRIQWFDIGHVAMDQPPRALSGQGDGGGGIAPPQLHGQAAGIRDLPEHRLPAIFLLGSFLSWCSEGNERPSCDCKNDQ